jgi:hypothetical protein
MIFYCPNCSELEYPKVSYTDKDIIFNNCRDGYGLMIHNVICKKCSYPLSAFMYCGDDHAIEYYKTLITGYQNGYYESKENMLKLIKSRYEKTSRTNVLQVINASQVIKYCDMFLGGK